MTVHIVCCCALAVVVGCATPPIDPPTVTEEGAPSAVRMSESAPGDGGTCTPVTVPAGRMLTAEADHDRDRTDGYRLYVDATPQSDSPASAQIVVGKVQLPVPELAPGVHVMQVGAFNAAGQALGCELTVTAVLNPPNGIRDTRLRGYGP